MATNLKSLLKNKKVSFAIFIIGILGILLIFISDLFSGNTKEKTVSEKVYSEDEYCTEMESKIKNIVQTMTGNENVQVIVTLESSYEYVYLNEKDLSNDYTNEKDTSTKTKDNSSEKYIIVEDSDGNESGLLVTTLSPTIRGVVIIFKGNGVDLSEEVKSAVMAALNISSSKIYVSCAA